MRRKEIIWIVLFVLAILLVLAEKYLPYLPGDVAAMKLVQSLLPESRGWAKWLSSTAEMPWVLILVVMIFSLCWTIAGWRAALFSVFSIIGVSLLGVWLGPIIGQPRPSTRLVHVSGLYSGSAFPSIFALRYASTVGFLAALAIVKTRGGMRWILVLTCGCLLFAGLLARLALGAHWPSDICLSYLIGFLWVALMIRCV
jgi:membrane-associated phospholipid phosphatase